MEDKDMLPTLFRFTRPSLIDDLFSNNFMGGISDSNPYSYSLPAVNITEDNENFRIELAAPGYSKEDFKINLNNDVLTISSEKKELKDENEKYSRREFSYSSFSRNFTLSEHVDAEKISASYKDGVLSITLPKKEEARVKPVREIEIA